MDERYNDPQYLFTDMNIHVTVKKEISMHTDLRRHPENTVISLSASTVLSRVDPMKLQDTFLAIKNYAREFNKKADETFSSRQ